jgi:DNA-directed RNA polymerase specialized sigma24 family protein
VPKVKEYPYSPEHIPKGKVIVNTRSGGPYKAVMECRPGEQPDWGQEELLGLRDILQDALDQLEPLEIEVFDAIVVERLSFRDLSKRMGVSKSQLHRTKDICIAKLQVMLGQNPAILTYLEEQ